MEETKIVWPGWETVRPLGHGSFGAVYEIRRTIRSRTERAALKVLSIPQYDSEIDELRSDGYDEESIHQYFIDSLNRIEGEYAMMADMKGHANVVYCDDFRKIPHENGYGWDVFIKMELLTPLKSYLKENPEDGFVLRLACDICNALILCEELNVVHRDIKPENIFVARDGNFKLGDFGIARTMESTTGGTKTGTYDYMAPEVYNNLPYHLQTDIYSLGLVLYWLLNERTVPFLEIGTRPTPSMKAQARERRFSGEPLPPPNHGSEGLKAIVLKACAYNPKMRFQSAGEMLEALKALTQSIPEEPTPVYVPPVEAVPPVVEPEEAAAVGKLMAAGEPGEPVVDETAVLPSPVQEEMAVSAERQANVQTLSTGSRRLPRFLPWVAVLLCLAVAIPLGLRAYRSAATSAAEAQAISTAFTLVLSEDRSSYIITDYAGEDANVVIPETYRGKPVAGISGYAFWNCEGLQQITIPDSVTTIGDAAFSGCCNLTKIAIPTGVTHIADNLFYGCTALREVILPAGVTDIGASAFSGCSALAAVALPEGVITIGKDAFYLCTGLTQVTVPATVTQIGASAFYGCVALAQLSELAGVTGIGDSAFWGCTALKSVAVSGSSVDIGASAFYGCTALESVTVSGSSVAIGSSAFWGCSALKEITLPHKGTGIGESAFHNCKALVQITIPEGTASIGESAFNSCNALVRVTVLGGVESIGASAFSGCYKLEKINLPQGVKTIGASAFNNCVVLKELTLPDSLISIGDHGFHNCNAISSLVIPDSVVSIGRSAFSGCSSMGELVLSAGLTTIEEYTFWNCKALTEITIPDNVESIGKYAFASCVSLKNVTLPGGMTALGESVFSNCSSLKNIYYRGTQAQWRAVEKGADWNSNAGRYSIHYTS